MAQLVLEDGTVFEGNPFGYMENTIGELVFQTGMVGYVESLTDPSFLNQIVVFTYPMIGNYGVPDRTYDSYGILENFESEKIHASGLVVSCLCSEGHSKRKDAVESLNSWLFKEKICGIEIIDTRKLVKHIRHFGSMRCQILIDSQLCDDFSLLNIDACTISIKEPKHFSSSDPDGPHVIAVDCGIKNNIIRSLLSRGINVVLVPINYDFLPLLSSSSYHGLFLSNGPGDPKNYHILIKNVMDVLDSALNIPIFGVCLGNQVLGLANGIDTFKMSYGHRSHNQPCKDMIYGQCFVTAQNHGYALYFQDDFDSSWKSLFVNVNDMTNEGIYHNTLPYFSVQFHPERRPGPGGTEFLFDIFYLMLRDYQIHHKTKPFTSYYRNQLSQANRLPFEYNLWDIKPRINRRVLVLGSGGLHIGQAGEFDYSGSQAIKALREAGMHVILINPNIATAQTTKGVAESVYFLPLLPNYVERVIEGERPDSILLSVGGQTALNCGVELFKNKVFEKYNIQVLGTNILSIISSEDREIFSKKINEIGEEVPPSECAYSLDSAVKIARKFGYPLLVRSSYALGGSGSGLAFNDKTFSKLVCNALASSPQVIIDQYLEGWKEVEYEVLRDSNNDCITVCNMENIDPVGIHTGDSIVLAPSQTLNDDEYQSLRNISIKVARHFDIIGECNVQFALCPVSKKTYIIEINARLSRSSALASKATGYPIAYISTKLALGQKLADLKNIITRSELHPEGTSACFEPSLDYLVIKIPKWDFDKFANIERSIGTSMKSVGEVMAIGRNFNECLQKALRMVDSNNLGICPHLNVENLPEWLEPSPQRLHRIASALYSDFTIDDIFKATHIDTWFLYQIKSLVDEIKQLEKWSLNFSINKIPIILLLKWKRLGFSDKQIGHYFKCPETHVQFVRTAHNITPFVKRIDTVSAEYPSITNYFYLTYNSQEHDDNFQSSNSILVLGSGPYRIGSSVEFDCSSVNCVRELRRMKRQTIMLNCNPETVSTDFDECDRMYFDEITPEVVHAIYKLENPEGVIICMSGQAPNNIASSLHLLNIKILGTQPDMIDNAENRFKFSRLLDELNIYQPIWKELTAPHEAIAFCHEVGYPCLVRPSYVLSGEAMNVAFCDAELIEYLSYATLISNENPVVISKFLQNCKEFDLDAVACNGKLVALSLAEHIENAGVHSGDSTLILPPIDLNRETFEKILLTINKIAKALHVNGPFNLQLIAKDNEVYIIECNLRVSRTFPLSSKAYDVDLISISTRCILGIVPEENFQSFGAHLKRYAVKVPHFSFRQLTGSDVVSGVEMRSTGEVACFGETPHQAFLKAFMSSGSSIPKKKIFISIEPYKMKLYLLETVISLLELDYVVYADEETCDFYTEHNLQIQCLPVAGILECGPSEMGQYFRSRDIEMIVYITYQSCFNIIRREDSSKGRMLARFAVDNCIPLVTNAQVFKFLSVSLSELQSAQCISRCIDSIQSGKIIKLPYLVDCHTHMRDPGQTHKEDFFTGTSAALAGGLSCVLCMPNTNPPLTDTETYETTYTLANSKCVCDYGLIAGGSAVNVPSLSFLSKKCAALKLYLNDTFTSLRLDDVSKWVEHFKNWPDNVPIMVHAEQASLGTALYLTLVYKKKLHVCHVSKKIEIELIKSAKKQNIDVTCEVAPHHLFLTSDHKDVIGEKRINVKPALGTCEDQKALWDNMEYIDCFATDHAPHTLAEKDSTSPPGFPGVETMLPLLLTAVNQNRLTIDDIILRLHTNPLKIFNLQDQPNSYVEVDMSKNYKISASTFHSKSGWTPFEGFDVSACVDRVVIRGVVAYIGQKVLVKPGFGINVISYSPTQRFSKSTPLIPVKVEPITPISYIPKTAKSIDLLTTLLNSEDAKWFHGRSLLTVKGLDLLKIKLIFNVARELRALNKTGSNMKFLEGKVLSLAFIEASTRTMLSFQAAMQRLGGSTMILGSESSMTKGETFEDTIRALSSFSDAMVVRHNIANILTESSNLISIPIINGGDGIGEHPSQALLDFFTIREEIGTINNLTISLVGDLKHGRTTHSFAFLSVLFKNITLNYVSPKELEMPNFIKEYLSSYNVVQKEFSSLSEVIKSSDVIYMTRIQKERFISEKDYIKYKGMYILTPDLLSNAKPKMIVMHPLPRIDEIDKNLDYDPRSAYFRQMEYGMYTRMALLLLILKKSD